jgi:hypothetical protein
MYKLEGLMFQYKPTSGEGAGVSNQLGKIIMATDYDPMADPFINSVQMENYQYSQSTKPSLPMKHGVETDPKQGITDMKYVRTGVSARDKSFTDYGLFQIATEGIPIHGNTLGVVNNNIGELWVAYKVRLSRANLYSSLLGLAIKNDLYDIDIPTQVLSIGAAVPSSVITTFNSTIRNNIGTTLTFRQGGLAGGFPYPDSLTITFPPSQILGTYKVTIMTYSNRLIDVALNQATWVPILPGYYTGAGSVDRTQWGSSFLPIRNIYDDTKTIPSVDLTTGLPVWVDALTNLAERKNCYFASEPGDAAAPCDSQTTMYFALNSPSTTVPKFCIGCYQYSASANTRGVPVTDYFTAATRFRIFIEQVNADVSL